MIQRLSGEGVRQAIVPRAPAVIYARHKLQSDLAIEEQAMPKNEKRVIKRYANRKLYDTEIGRFTTLDELAKLVEAGRKIVVVDHDSGDDRTDEVLAQVLGRRMRSAPGGTDLLAGLLRGPARIAMELADELVPQEAAKAPQNAAKPTKAAKVSAKSDKPKKAKANKPSKAERQEAELNELRNQVSELTQAVTLLLQEKVAERENEK